MSFSGAFGSSSLGASFSGISFSKSVSSASSKASYRVSQSFFEYERDPLEEENKLAEPEARNTAFEIRALAAQIRQLGGRQPEILKNTNTPYTEEDVQLYRDALRSAEDARIDRSPTVPSFIVAPNGTVLPVPPGASGPSPALNRAGVQRGVAFEGGAMGPREAVTSLRLMDPTPAKGPIRAYPSGYGVYMNSIGQTVNPFTARTPLRSDPLAHIPFD